MLLGMPANGGKEMAGEIDVPETISPSSAISTRGFEGLLGWGKRV